MRTDCFSAAQPTGGKGDRGGKTWARNKAEVLRALSQTTAPSIKDMPDGPKCQAAQKSADFIGRSVGILLGAVFASAIHPVEASARVRSNATSPPSKSGNLTVCQGATTISRERLFALCKEELVTLKNQRDDLLKSPGGSSVRLQNLNNGIAKNAEIIEGIEELQGKPGPVSLPGTHTSPHKSSLEIRPYYTPPTVDNIWAAQISQAPRADSEQSYFEVDHEVAQIPIPANDAVAMSSKFGKHVNILAYHDVAAEAEYAAHLNRSR